MTIWVGTKKGLFELTDEGEIAGVHFPAEPVVNVAADPRDGSVMTTISYGHFGSKLHRTTDGGATWPELPMPAYPPKPDDAPDFVGISGAPVPWNVELLWELAPGHADRPGQWWAGTIPGGLFRSDDHGQNWALNRSLWDDPSREHWFGGGYDFPGLHTICVHPDEPDTMLLGISTAGAWLTTDGGDSWSAAAGLRNAYAPPGQEHDPVIQDVHRLSQSASDPDIVWCQHHNGVFVSSDGGRSFTELDPPVSNFGFPVVTSPVDGGTAWFVPAIADQARVPVDGQVAVTRTRDGGKTWSVSTAGLPGPHAYDLVYRHGLAVDPTGTRLAMGSTTGAVWLSDDAGDTWREVSAHLPQVNAIKIA